MRKMEQHVHKKNAPCPSYYIATALPKCSYLPPAMEHLLFYGQSNILPIISRMLSLWSVKFIHLCLPNLCLPSYSPVSVLCLQQTGYISTRPYFVLGSWIRTAADANMVDPLIMSGVFFSNLYSFSMVRFFYWIMVRLWMCCYKCMYLLVPFVLFPPDEIREPLPSWLNHLPHPIVLGLTNFNENQQRSCPICISFTLCLLCVDESLQFLTRQ